MFHHMGVQVTDFEKARPMYDAVFEILEYEAYELPGYTARAWGTSTCSFRIFETNLLEVSASSGHVCFRAPSADAVRQFFKVGQEFGAIGKFAPNEYVDYGHRHLTAMLCDTDGNHIEAVYVDPAPVEGNAEQ